MLQRQDAPGHLEGLEVACGGCWGAPPVGFGVAPSRRQGLGLRVPIGMWLQGKVLGCPWGARVPMGGQGQVSGCPQAHGAGFGGAGPVPPPPAVTPLPPQAPRAVTSSSTTCPRSSRTPRSCRCSCPSATSSLPRSSWTAPRTRASASVGPPPPGDTGWGHHGQGLGTPWPGPL